MLLGDCSVQYSIVILCYLITCLILDCYLNSFVRYCNPVPVTLLGYVFLGHAVWDCNGPDIVILSRLIY